MPERFQLRQDKDGLYLVIMGVAFGPFQDKWEAERETRKLHSRVLAEAQKGK